MNCFGFGFSMNSASSAANCDGSCAARTSSHYAVIAGIAAAVSVLFISALLSLRLSLGLLGLILLITIIVSIIIFIVAGLTYGGLDITYTVLYIAFGIIFLLYMPVTLWLRSKSALAASEVLRGTLHYLVDENGFTVSQGEESANLPWDQIYKMVATKSNVLVYSTRINAYIIPREQLGEQYKDLAKIANEKLPKHRVKMQ